MEKEKVSNEKMLDYSIQSGAQDCILKDSYFEILCKKEDFYKVKNDLESKIGEIGFSEIGWIPTHTINVNKDQYIKIGEFINSLEDDDDVQKVYANFDSKNN